MIKIAVSVGMTHVHNYIVHKGPLLFTFYIEGTG